MVGWKGDDGMERRRWGGKGMVGWKGGGGVERGWWGGKKVVRVGARNEGEE